MWSLRHLLKGLKRRQFIETGFGAVVHPPNEKVSEQGAINHPDLLAP